MRAHRPVAVVMAAVAVLAGTAVLVGCGADDDTAPPAADTTPVTRPVPTPPDTDATAGAGGTTPTDGTSAATAEVLRFDAPGEVACAGTGAEVEVAYATRNVTAVGFAVDGASVDGPLAPTTGVHPVPVPCDGRVHTIMLIGSGPDGPVFASKAVISRPA